MSNESYFNSGGRIKDEPVTHDTDVAGLHEDNLFDQDERSVDGSRYDEATGEPYDNSTATNESAILETGHIDPNTDMKHDTQEMDIVNPDADLNPDSDVVKDARTDAWLVEFDVPLTTYDIPPEPIEDKTSNH